MGQLMAPEQDPESDTPEQGAIAVRAEANFARDIDSVAQRMAAALAQRCDASTDEEALKTWLNSHAATSAQTRRSYEREGRRLLAWLAWRKGADERLLPLITLPEATAFIHWLSAPGDALIPAEVLALAGLPPTQPVKSGLSRASLSQAVVILSGLYLHLVTLQAPWGTYARSNPFGVLKGPVRKGIQLDEDGTPNLRATPKPSTRPGGPQGKALSRAVWTEVLATIELMPQDTPAQKALYWQTWWVVRLQHHSVFRRHESVKAQMSDVARSNIGYELRVVGKGNKEASILMSEAFVRDLRTYRQALGLSPMPRHDETGPLILHTDPEQRRLGKHISESTLYRRVTGVFECTAERLDEDVKRLEESGATPDTIDQLKEDVVRLREATLHGVRHTGITHLLDAGVSMRTTSKHARHASIATTAVYDSQQQREQKDEMDRAVAKWREPVSPTLSYPSASVHATVPSPSQPDHDGTPAATANQRRGQ